AAAQLPELSAAVDEGLKWAQRAAGSNMPPRDYVIRLGIDWLAVQLGIRLLGIIPGRIAVDLDARLANDVRGLVERARWLISHFDAGGAPRSRVLMRLPATWEGIRSAEILEKEGIHTCLTLVFGMHQAVAAAEVRATLVAPLVGRIVDWHRHQSGIETYSPAEDPGVAFVRRVYNYYKHHNFATEVMAGSVPNLAAVSELARRAPPLVPPHLLARPATP